MIAGTAEKVANDMEQWFRRLAADGFKVNIDRLADGLTALNDALIPELRRRSIFRYRGKSLRDH